MITLYDYELSSDCYKVRLLMAALRIPFERIELDFYPGCEHLSPEFLAINPLGQLPVIDADGFILRDAQAILVYLARKHDQTGLWSPCDSAENQGRIAMWLAFAQSLSTTAGAARLHDALCYALARAVDGLVGAGGLGFSLITSMKMFKYHETATCILMIILLIWAADAISSHLQKKIL